MAGESKVKAKLLCQKVFKESFPGELDLMLANMDKNQGSHICKLLSDQGRDVPKMPMLIVLDSKAFASKNPTVRRNAIFPKNLFGLMLNKGGNLIKQYKHTEGLEIEDEENDFGVDIKEDILDAIIVEQLGTSHGTGDLSMGSGGAKQVVQTLPMDKGKMPATK